MPFKMKALKLFFFRPPSSFYNRMAKRKFQPLVTATSTSIPPVVNLTHPCVHVYCLYFFLRQQGYKANSLKCFWIVKPLQLLIQTLSNSLRRHGRLVLNLIDSTHESSESLPTNAPTQENKKKNKSRRASYQ